MIDPDIVVAGHRGFKAEFTENTLYGFSKCYESGATNIETDVWLTLDNEVVISHDVNTKRIFVEEDGTPADHNILNSKFDELKNLRTHTGEKLLTFRDVLEWYVTFVETKEEKHLHKLMLDIKRLNPPKLLRYLISNILSVKNDISWWLPRIQFGVWDLNMVKYFNQHEYFQEVFQDTKSQFDIYHISLNWRDSLHYISYNEYLNAQPDTRIKFKVTGISILYILTWNTGFVLKFLPLLRMYNMRLYSWTVNNFAQLDYIIALQKAYRLPEMGIISDNPAKMVDYLSKEEIREQFTESVAENNKATTIHITFKQKLAHFLFDLYARFSGVKRVTKDELCFSDPVDENMKRTMKFNKITAWIFQTCQKFGIF